MAKKDIYQIKVINWEKHNPNPKKVYRRALVHHGFLSDAKIRQLPPCTKLLYLSCLLVAGESQQSQIEVSHESLVFQSGVKSGSIQSQLDLLESLQLLTYDKNEPLLEWIGKERNRKEKIIIKKKIRKQPLPSVADSEFQKVYENYPKKAGKAAGMKLCRRTVTDADLPALATAIANYRNHLEREKTEPRFIKHFSTFMNEWRDWIDPTHGSSDISSARLDAEYREKERKILAGLPYDR